jgi:tetratricopeptide (TPR) repeat protein
MSDTRRRGFSKLRLRIRFASLLLALGLAYGEAHAGVADDAQALVATSDVIFTGKAMAIELIWPIWLTPANAELRGPCLRTRFEIETGWKGVHGKVLSVDEYEILVYIPCGSSLRIGGTYTVFAHGSPARGFRTSPCMVMSAGDEERFLPALEAYRAKVAAFDAAGAGADAVRAKARFLSENHDWSGALEAFDQLFAERPGDEEAIAGRARALAALDRHEDALADFDRMLALDPGDTEAQRNRIIALFKLGRTRDIDRQTGALAKGEFAGISLVDRDLSGLDRRARGFPTWISPAPISRAQIFGTLRRRREQLLRGRNSKGRIFRTHTPITSISRRRSCVAPTFPTRNSRAPTSPASISPASPSRQTCGRRRCGAPT